MGCCGLYVGYGLAAEFLDFWGHGFYEVEVEDCVYYFTFSFPLLALAEGYAPTHGSNDRRSGELKLLIGIQMLIGIKIPNKIRVTKIKHNPMQRITQDNIIVPVDSLTDLERVSLFVILLYYVVERDTHRGEWGCVDFVAHFLEICEVEVVEFSGGED